MTDKRYYAPSELILNSDGTVFHLHLSPAQISDKVILVGDPDRVTMIARHFQSIECEVSNREFHTITGLCNGKRITALSTGIGCGNIDIVLNELDALANIDFSTREDRDAHTTLSLVRIDTCGGLQMETGLGSYVCSRRSIGLDGLLNFYAGRDAVCDTPLQEAFIRHMGWENLNCGLPYAAVEDEELTARIAGSDMLQGITVSAGGFFGPQGRFLRAQPMDLRQNEKIESFEWKGMRINNYEMESSALAGLAAILGHKAACVCMVVAGRRTKEAFTDYHEAMDRLISTVLERI